MSTRERRSREREEETRHAPSGQPGGGDLDALRGSVERLFRAGDTAIDRALSKDSERFLDDSEQEGGE